METEEGVALGLAALGVGYIVNKQNQTNGNGNGEQPVGETRSVTIDTTGGGSVDVFANGEKLGTVNQTRTFEVEAGSTLSTQVHPNDNWFFKRYSGISPPFEVNSNQTVIAIFRQKDSPEPPPGPQPPQPPIEPDTSTIGVNVTGPGGKAIVKVDGSTRRTIDAGNTATIQVENGKSLDIETSKKDFTPPTGYELRFGGFGTLDMPFLVRGDRDITVSFSLRKTDDPTEPSPDPPTGNPYGIPDSHWSNLQPDVQAFLEDPENNDKDSCIVFGFKGWFNDDAFAGSSGCGGHYPNYSESYAQNVAEIVKKDAELHGPDECLINVHWVNPPKTATNKTKQKLLEKIQNW